MMVSCAQLFMVLMVASIKRWKGGSETRMPGVCGQGKTLRRMPTSETVTLPAAP